jgi:hypothetical protein
MLSAHHDIKFIFLLKGLFFSCINWLDTVFNMFLFNLYIVWLVFYLIVIINICRACWLFHFYYLPDSDKFLFILMEIHI